MTPKKIKRRFRRFSIKFFWPLLPAGLLIGLVILLAQLKSFNISKVNCTLDGHPCSLEFETILISFYQKNIFKLNKNQVSNQLTLFDSTLSDIKILKKLPSTLAIQMKKTLPIAQIIPVDDLEFHSLESTKSATISGDLLDQFYKLDKHGNIYQKLEVKSPNLSVVLLASNFPLSIGKTDISQILADLITTLNSHYVKFNNLVWLETNQIILKTSLGPYAVFDSTQNLVSSVASLQYILTNIKISEDLPTKIDLRFDKPVLTY